MLGDLLYRKKYLSCVSQLKRLLLIFIIITGLHSFCIAGVFNQHQPTAIKESCTDTLIQSKTYFKNGKVQSVTTIFCDRSGKEYRRVMEEFRNYFKNGNLRSVVLSYYEPNGREYKTLTEYYRKDGFKISAAQYNDHQVAYYASYENNHLACEKFYNYDKDGNLLSLETKAGGSSSYQHYATVE